MAVSYQSYATVVQFASFGLPSTAYTGIVAGTGGTQITNQNISDQLLASSSYADAHLAAQFSLPLKMWGTDLTMHVCAHAAYELMVSVRGMNPEGGEDTVLKDRYDAANLYFRNIAEQKITPQVVDSSSGGSGAAAPQVISGLSGTSVGAAGALGQGFYNGVPYQPTAYPYAPGQQRNRRGY